MRQAFLTKIISIFLFGFFLLVIGSALALNLSNNSGEAIIEGSSTNGKSLNNEYCLEDIR